MTRSVTPYLATAILGSAERVNKSEKVWKGQKKVFEASSTHLAKDPLRCSSSDFTCFSPSILVRRSLAIRPHLGSFLTEAQQEAGISKYVIIHLGNGR